MILGIPKETLENEKRVALVPEALSKIKGLEIHVQSGAGEAAGFTDEAYRAKGAVIVSEAKSLYEQSDVILKVMPPEISESSWMKEGAVLISFVYPHSHAELLKSLAAKKVSVFAMDLIPRTSRAQFMDALSSQATIAGYKAAVLAIDSLPKIFPMLITAAGTISAARVFVIGAGVAGLQAIATAHRMGASVEAYDLRPVVKEQIESLGAKFVSLPLEAQDAQTSGGYAKAQSEEFYRKQQEFLAKTAQNADVVITTALVPGKRAPVLLSENAVKGMKPSSVIVDLAAEQGGNCALTEPGKTVVKYGVTIHGLFNLPAMIPGQASLMYSRNISAFLALMLKDGKVNIDLKDDLLSGSLAVHNGEVLFPKQPAPVAVAAGGKAA